MRQNQKQRTASLRELFVAWFKIGLFTFGGGYAMLPLIEREVIDNKGWTDKEEILSILFETAYIDQGVYKIINPLAFIAEIQARMSK